ncbi:FCD domain-containing protein [Pseudovibrio sp. Tun.PSC04-5.I4]|uniref:FadR/GntR family transcriptional regulator n=1 Tax=Pseudovibrio sp. Tun.PSC04-5.I4 TaxID=1798213 RepID=UPI000A6C90DB|nr:FCD domain-containing protein [Pseudovibrio sp. Tun.PSC04-5.I4]
MSSALINLISRNQTAFYDFLEYRRVQEGFAAGLAAERATKLDLDWIEELLVNLPEAQAAGDDSASKKSDIAFHSSIVDASHNAMLVHMMSSIYELTKKACFITASFCVPSMGLENSCWIGMRKLGVRS